MIRGEAPRLALALAALSAALGGCATTALHTSAQAVPEGRVELTGYGSGILWWVEADTTALTVAGGGAARVGVTQWLDLAVTADSTTGAMADVKFELVDNDDLAFAIDLAAGVTWSGIFQGRAPLLLDLPLGTTRLTFGVGYQQLSAFSGILGLIRLSVPIVAEQLWFTALIDTAYTFVSYQTTTQLALGLTVRL